MQDPISIIPTVVTEATGVENENHPDATLDLIDSPGHEATVDPGEGLRGRDRDEVAVQGHPLAGAADEGVRQQEGRPIRQRKPNPKYTSDVYVLNFARMRSRSTIRRAL